MAMKRKKFLEYWEKTFMVVLKRNGFDDETAKRINAIRKDSKRDKMTVDAAQKDGINPVDAPTASLIALLIAKGFTDEETARIKHAYEETGNIMLFAMVYQEAMNDPFEFE